MAEESISHQKGVRVGAALFNGDHGRLAEEVALLEASGLDFVHLDVFDGYLIADLGFPPRTIASLRPLTNLPFEVHLGAVEPLRFMPQLVESGVDLVLFHAEGSSMLYETVFTAREHGVKVGLALSLGTPVERLEPVVSQVDAVLLLSRVTGESVSGAGFDPLVLHRVSVIREMVDNTRSAVNIQVAGGVKRSHVPEIVAAGADTLALGGGLYKAPDMAREVEKIRATASGAPR